MPLRNLKKTFPIRYTVTDTSLAYSFPLLTPTPFSTAARLAVSEYKNGIIRFSYPPSATAVFSLTVPYGSSVTINGILAESEYITENGLKYPFLTRFEEKLTGLPSALTYQIVGLFRTPQISVTYNGVPLEASGKNCYRLPSDMTKSYKIYAPSDAVVKLNGVSLGPIGDNRGKY